MSSLLRVVRSVSRERVDSRETELVAEFWVSRLLETEELLLVEARDELELELEELEFLFELVVGLDR